MSEAPWLERVEAALDFEDGFEIFLLVGTASLARPALGWVADRLRRFGQPRWHALHVDGLDSLIAEPEAGPRAERVLHLVHGFERMPARLAEDTVARLNLNRDGLAALAAPMFVWVGRDFYEQLLRHAPDFVAWRSQVSVVRDEQFGVSASDYAREALLCRAQIEAWQRAGDIPDLDVELPTGRRPLLDWALDGSARSIVHDRADDPIRVLIRLAGQLALAHEGGRYEPVPLLLAATLEALLDDPVLAEGVEELWRSGQIDLVLDVPLSSSEWDAIVAQVGSRSVLGAVMGDPGDRARVAALRDEQAAAMIERSLTDLRGRERDRWVELLHRTLELGGERLRSVGALAAVIAHWRQLGLASVSAGLDRDLWRVHSLRNALAQVTSEADGEFGGPLHPPVEALLRPEPELMARVLHELGRRAGEGSLLRRAASLDDQER